MSVPSVGDSWLVGQEGTDPLEGLFRSFPIKESVRRFFIL